MSTVFHLLLIYFRCFVEEHPHDQRSVEYCLAKRSTITTESNLSRPFNWFTRLQLQGWTANIFRSKLQCANVYPASDKLRLGWNRKTENNFNVQDKLNRYSCQIWWKDWTRMGNLNCVLKTRRTFRGKNASVFNENCFDKFQLIFSPINLLNPTLSSYCYQSFYIQFINDYIEFALHKHIFQFSSS